MMNSKLHKIFSAIDASSLPQTELTDATLKTVLQFVFGLAGAIAFLVIVIAGLRYTLSGGKAESISKAKNTIIYALVGLIISISGYTIVSFVVARVK